MFSLSFVFQSHISIATSNCGSSASENTHVVTYSPFPLPALCLHFNSWAIFSSNTFWVISKIIYVFMFWQMRACCTKWSFTWTCPLPQTALKSFIVFFLNFLNSSLVSPVYCTFVQNRLSPFILFLRHTFLTPESRWKPQVFALCNCPCLPEHRAWADGDATFVHTPCLVFVSDVSYTHVKHSSLKCQRLK